VSKRDLLKAKARALPRRAAFWATMAALGAMWLLDVPRQADVVLHAGAGHPYHYVSASGNTSRPTFEGTIP
jgi:hypothetical protein